MSNNPFDRTVINTRERPISSDLNQAQSQIDRTLRFFLEQLLAPRVSITDERKGTPVSGFIGNGFQVREQATPGMFVDVKLGLGFKYDASDVPPAVGGVPGVDDLNPYKPLLLMVDAFIFPFTGIPVPTSDPTNDRIDIVEVNINRRLADAASRDVLNPVTGVFDPTAVQKSLAWNVGTSIDNTVVAPANSTAALSYKAGVPSGSPTPAPTSPGYLKVAQILVGNGVTQIDQNVITDLRFLLDTGQRRRVAVKATYAATPAGTLNALFAAPGVRVSANRTVGADRRLYILAGDVTGLTAAAVGTKETAAALSVATSVVVADTALQTELATAVRTDPIMNVAVGQTLIRVDLDDDTVYHLNVEF